MTKVVLLTTAEKTITDLQAKKVADDKAVAEKAAADKTAAEQAAAQAAAEKQAAATHATTQQVASSDTQSTTVYITKTGKKYHLAGCQSLSKSQIPISLADAKSKGYTACENCDPPQ
ncbi:hypothetical protein [Acetobacterium woodii]|uniref:Beta-lactamase-like protein n=1 Tax=Acetobacterium woodii (strain ATCC 29683 / DSM 1030 / JCM 2381 / KCTC 1655 / WB1) TaxID=931626 RepID=H6LFC3_ACEWD|nr:hypothetical protein [Acetobacterium woodii]AFA48223.1 beta-lactamase-like protein [Acetobacterium woodii DSM 1030]